jgi:hypothetical protein
VHLTAFSIETLHPKATKSAVRMFALARTQHMQSSIKKMANDETLFPMNEAESSLNST